MNVVGTNKNESIAMRSQMCELKRLDDRNYSVETEAGQFLLNAASLRTYRVDASTLAAARAYCSDEPASRTSANSEVTSVPPLAAALDDSGEEPERSSEWMIQAVLLHLSADCDLSCRYCYSGGENTRYGGERAKMTADTALRTVDYLLDCDLVDRRGISIGFFGGEPLINYPVLETVIEHCEHIAQLRQQSPGLFRFNLTTNGLSLTAERCAYLLRHGVRIRMSVDGMPEAHDRNRVTRSGRGSHDIVVRNLQNAIAERPELVSVRATLTPDNIDLLQMDDFFTSIGVSDYGFDIAVAPPGQQTFWTSEALDRLDESYAGYFQRLLALVESGVRTGHGLANVLARVGKIHSRDANSIPCNMGREMIAVSPEGKFYPCQWLVDSPQFCIGDVDAGLDPSARHMLFPAFVPEKESCAACWARRLCDGACPAISFLQYGNDDRADPAECRERLITWKWTLWFYLALLDRGLVGTGRRRERSASQGLSR